MTDNQPTAGTVLVHRGQVYRFLARIPYVNRHGFKTTLLRWQSACPDCGQPFQTSSPSKFPPLYLTRRCAACKSPGKRVTISNQHCRVSYVIR